MSSVQLCPTCFAEVYSQEVCDFCGASLVESLDETESTTVAGSHPSNSDKLAKFELVGMPFSVGTYVDIPKGVLFDKRYSILRFKQRLEEGWCYIAYDHALTQHCFVTFWDQRSALSQYHQCVVHISSVVDAGEMPFYSAFLPQDGLPLEEALQTLGWSNGRVWEVFRQVCQLVSTAESEARQLDAICPENIWVRPDGLVEFSVNPTIFQTDYDQHVQQLIVLLGWMYSPNSELDLHQFPLKLRKTLLRGWNEGEAVHLFWKALNETIHQRGWYQQPDSDREWLLNNHHPNKIFLMDEIVEVPSSVQLCVWNAVTGSWRLCEGDILLEGRLESLLEAGILGEDSISTDLQRFEGIYLELETALEQDSLIEAVWHLRYGNRSAARLYLAEQIRVNQQATDWIEMVRAYFAIAEEKVAWELFQLSKEYLVFLRELLDMAAMIRWCSGDISIARKLLVQFQRLAVTVWECTEYVEAWMALIGDSRPPIDIVQRLGEGLTLLERTEREEWEQYLDERLGWRAPKLRYQLQQILPKETT